MKSIKEEFEDYVKCVYPLDQIKRMSDVQRKHLCLAYHSGVLMMATQLVDTASTKTADEVREAIMARIKECEIMMVNHSVADFFRHLMGTIGSAVVVEFITEAPPNKFKLPKDDKPHRN